MALSVAASQRYTREAAASQRRWSQLLERVTERTRLTPAGLILVGVAVAAWAGGYWIGGRPLYLMAYGAVGVLMLSWLLSSRQPPITGQRSQPQARLREGQSISVDVSLTASRRLTTLILEERLPPSLGAPQRVPIAELAEGETAGHSYQLTCWRRGVYQLGPLMVRWGDPFGLTQRRMPICEPFELFVHPRVEPATDRPLTRLWEDPPVRPPFSRPWPSGMEFYGMRAYQPGDDVRRVVWRAYARSGALLVREAEQGVTDKFVMLIDQDRANHSDGVVSESFEAAMRVAASLGVHHLREGYTVTAEGTSGRLFGPARSRPIQLLDALSRAEPEKGSLSKMLERVLVRVPSDAEVVVVTPLLTADAAARLRLLLNRGVAVIVVALMWLDEAVDTLGVAASLGLQVVEVGPRTNLTMAFRHEVGGGTR